MYQLCLEIMRSCERCFGQSKVVRVHLRKSSSYLLMILPSLVLNGFCCINEILIYIIVVLLVAWFLIEEIIVASNYPNQGSNTWGGRYICVHLFLSYPLEINRHPLSMAFHNLCLDMEIFFIYGRLHCRN
jgi:hypothetical protein